jgi:ABC-type hemin transport system substrate-binding protein
MCATPLTYSIARACRAGALIALLAGAAPLAGCDGRSQSDERLAVPNAVRIASMSPAITECLVELGLSDRIVGRTPWCDLSVPDVPVVGTLLDVDAEALVRASPTVVLVQPPAQGADPALEALASRHGWAVRAWPINGLDSARAAMEGIATVVAESDPPRAAEVRARHAQWRAALDDALAPLPEGTARGETVLVMMGGLEGISFGRGTYIDDALASMGVRNAVERSGYPALSAEDVVRIAPGTIVVIGGTARGKADGTGSLPSRVIRVPADGLAVPGGRLPHGLKALRDALVSRGGAGGG